MTSKTKSSRRNFRLAVILLSSSAIVGVPLAAFADSAWLGGTSNDWFNASNWSPAAVPTVTDDTVIDLNTNAPVIASGATTNGLTIGDHNTASLTVSGATLATHGIVYLGLNAGSNGTLTLQGGSTLSMDSGSQLVVGAGGTGVMTIETGSTANYDGAFIGANDGAGQLEVTGAGSAFTGNNITIGARNSSGSLIIDGGALVQNAHEIIVGNGGTGTMDVTDAGTILNSETLYIGTAGVGSVTIENGAVFNNSQDLVVGGAAPSQPASGGTANFSILNGATVLSSGTAEIGLGAGYTGTATVDGTGSNWQILNGLSVGKDGGNGTLTLSHEGAVTSGNLTVGVTTGSTGVVTAQDLGTQLQTLDMVIGGGGDGTLNVNAGAVVSTNGTTYVGEVLGGVGNVNVDGPGSEFDPNDLFIGGNDLDSASGGTGTLTITNGASVLPATVSLGLGAQSSGTITVDGTNSELQATGAMVIGAYGTGTVNISHGAAVSSATDISLGLQPGASGTVNVLDYPSDFFASGTLHIGVAGSGTLNITGGSVGVGATSLGEDASSTGTVVINGNGGFNVTGIAKIGVNGTGTVTIQPTGGAFTADTLILGANGGSHGALTLSYDGVSPGLSQAYVTNLTVGDAGTGVFTVGARGFVVVQDDAIVGAQAGSNGTLTVDGINASWQTMTGGLVAGQSSGAVGTVIVSNGAGASVVARTTLGAASGASGTMTVTDAGSEYDTFGDLFIGESGAGTLNIKNGGVFHAAALTFIGDNPGATGTLNIDGAGSKFTADDNIVVGGDSTNPSGGNGTVNVTNGGTLAGTGLYVGVPPGSTGTMTVDGAGSTVTGALLSIGYGGTGNVTVQDGGAITEGIVDVGSIPNSTGILIVDGAGSSVTASSIGAVGDFGTGTLLVRNGGAYIADQAYIGYEAAGSFTGVGTVTIDGAGSSLTAQSLDVGLFGKGSLILANGGVASVTNLTVATNTGAVGEIDIGAPPGSAAAAPGTLSASTVTFGAGTGAINFNHTDGNYIFAPTISGVGTINQIAGATFLTGDDSAFTGATNITGGALHVNDLLRSSAVTVSGGGALNGNGTVGSVSALNGGIVAPGNSIGTLTVNGNYSAAAGSIYQAQLDSAGHSDLLIVTGTATLANGAILNITKTDAGSYAPGKYTLLTAAGGVSGTYTLTNDLVEGSAFGSQSISYDANDVYLSVAKIASFASAGITPNQIAVGGGADSLPTSSPLYGALIALPSFAAAQGAFDQLSGEIHASARTALLEDSRFVREAALDRLAAPNVDQPVVWGQGFGDWGSNDGDGNAARLSRSTKGFIGGVDVPVYQTWRVGVMSGFSNTGLNVQGRSSTAASDNYHLGIYGGTQTGSVAIRAGFSYSWHDLQTARTVAFTGLNEQFSAEYYGGTTQGFGEVGYKFDAEDVNLEPFASLAYVSLHTGAFRETGGTSALSVVGDTSSNTFTTLGLHAREQVDLGTGAIFTAHGSLGWRHAFGDIAQTSTNAFAGGTTFTIEGVPVAQDAAAIDAGFDTAISDRLTLGLAYTGQYASSARDNGVKASLGWKF